MTSMIEIKKIILGNERLFENFLKIESKLLSILDYQTFIKKLPSEISKIFEIPYVWFSLINETEVTKLIKLCNGKNFQENINYIEKDIFLDIINNNTEPILTNENLNNFYKLFPESKNFLVKSIAIMPITLYGVIIGSLNLGDISINRYCPDLDPIFIKQFSSKISLCLTNVNAHEKLKMKDFYDSLTNLLNHRIMVDKLIHEFNYAKKYSSILSVAYMEIDQFKKINKNYGFEIGKNILKYVSDYLIKKAGESEIISRMISDEFIFIMPETDYNKAHKRINKIKVHFEINPFKHGKIFIPILINFGIASTEDVLINNYKLLIKTAMGKYIISKKARKVIILNNENNHNSKVINLKFPKKNQLN